jgi:hypothetical protein
MFIITNRLLTSKQPLISIINEIRNIEILPIVSAAIFKTTAIRSQFFFGQNILPTLFNIYAKSCGNPFGSFRYKWGQQFWDTFTVAMLTAAILKIPRPECTPWDGDPLSCEV